MPAELIWDNANPSKLVIPVDMGKPAAHQLQGSPLDNLAELCGRVCYDSLGSEKSRSSAEYHQHIGEVKHLSVYRHCTFTVEFAEPAYPMIRPEVFLNRPGIWVCRKDPDDPSSPIRVTLNLQHVIEWVRVKPLDVLRVGVSSLVDNSLRNIAKAAAPLACGHLNHNDPDYLCVGNSVAPLFPEERWLSFYISGVSRGLTHELVRHGAYTAPSQRSTRYCDEGDSEWIWHPMIVNGWDNQGFRHRLSLPTCAALQRAQDICQDAYKAVVDEMTANGAERKQARGAARGVLGNALETELIFSASLARWREIGALRNHPLADGEIRNLFAEIQETLPTA